MGSEQGFAGSMPQSELGAGSVGGAMHQTREFRVSLAVALIYSVLMIAQEHLFLSSMSEDGTVPYPMWLLLWPLGTLAIAVLMPIRIRLAFLGLIGLFWSLVVIGDAAYYRFFGSITSLVSAGSAHQLLDVRDSVFGLLGPSDLCFPAAFGMLGMTALLPSRVLLGDRGPSSFALRNRASLVALGMFVVVGLGARFTPIYEDTHHIARDKWVLPSEHWGSQFAFTTYATTFGLYNYHLRDVIAALDGGPRTEMTPAHWAAIGQVLDHKRRLNEIPTPFHGIARGRRVVFVQLEAITHWLLDLEVDGEPVMPFLSEMARSGLSWDFVMDVTFIGRTSDAEFAVMTGLPPDTSRPNSFVHADRASAYLPRALIDLGYSTASYHGYRKSFWNRAYTHPVYGFQKMYFDKALGSTERLGLGVPDQIVYDFLIEKLEEESALSFSFVISLTSHHPYVYTPSPYDRLFPSLDPANGWGLLGPYLRSARYADDALSRFFREMERRGLAEDTVFVFYGDHDMGTIATGKTLPQMSRFAYTVAEDRVPVVIVIPGAEALIATHRAAHTDATAGLQDLFPTLLHLLGAPVPNGLMSTNLLVPDALRDPLPLPPHGAEIHFAHRHAVHTSHGWGPIGPTPGGEKMPSKQIPTIADGLRDQLMTRDLLDHPHHWAADRERPVRFAKSNPN